MYINLVCQPKFNSVEIMKTYITFPGSIAKAANPIARLHYHRIQFMKFGHKTLKSSIWVELINRKMRC